MPKAKIQVIDDASRCTMTGLADSIILYTATFGADADPAGNIATMKSFCLMMHSLVKK